MENNNQELLKDSEANFSNLLNAIGDLIIVAKADGKILFTNKAFEKRLGYTTKDIDLLHVLELNPEENRKEAEEIFSEMFTGKRDFCPLPVVAKDGSFIPAETRVWFGKWNGQECIFGVIRDLSQEQEEKQKFERLFRNNPSLMAISDTGNAPERVFSDVNDAFLKHLGYSKQEVIGKSVQDLNLFVDPDKQIEVAKDLKETGHIFDKELKVRGKDGQILDGIFYGEIIKSQGKEYFLTVMIDVTERKILDKKIQSGHNKYLYSAGVFSVIIIILIYLVLHLIYSVK